MGERVKMREWAGYHNKQKYSECQLVTALNAKYFLTGHHIDQDSPEYEELVDLVLARIGSALQVNLAWDYLGIQVAKEFDTLDNLFKYLAENKNIEPISTLMWSIDYGSHDILIVENDLERVRIPNMAKHTEDGWIAHDEFEALVRRCPLRVGRQRSWAARQFALQSLKNIV